MRITPTSPWKTPALVLLIATAGHGCAPGPAAPTVRPTPRPTPLAQAGEPCGKDADCAAGLACGARVCRATGPACRWSTDCLGKLGELLSQAAVGHELTALGRELERRPTQAACDGMPARIAALLSGQPWVWKNACGAPPVAGVTRPTDRRPPFRIIEFKIKEAMIPADEKPEVHQRHAKHPELCKAWVHFEVVRPFQGFVVAEVREQVDCRAATPAELRADPATRTICKTRPYPVTDRRYLPLQPAGTKLMMSFYYSTPPEVCRKPGLSDKTYSFGCFCLGIDRSSVELKAVEDPFLLGDR